MSNWSNMPFLVCSNKAAAARAGRPAVGEAGGPEGGQAAG